MTFDIVIVGGGMVGAALACSLNSPALSVALIDATPHPALDDPRLIALNHGSINLLKNLSLFEKLTLHAAAIHQVHVSHKGRFGSTRINANELNLPALGYVVPAKHINAAIEEALQQSRVEVIRPATLIGLQEKDEAMYLTLNTSRGERSIQGKVLVAADGSHSTVRDLLSIPVESQDYHQSAIVTITELKRSHNNTAYERFVEQGAIAMLPLVGDRCATIWSTATEKANALMQLNDDEFLKRLQNEFGHRLGRLQSVSKRFIFPLQFIKAKKRVHNRAILIGNAAQTIHPLTAQGLNLALREVALLAQLLQMNPLNLKNIEDDLSPHWLNMHLSSWLNNLFSVDFFPVSTGRQMGMIGLNICGMIKKQFSAHLAGL